MKSFDEVIQAVKAQPGRSYIGFMILLDEKKLELYEISVDEEEPEFVNIWYEGGKLFSSCGEIESYDLDDMPAAVRLLRYIDKSTVPSMNGSTADYILHLLFPELPDPSSLFGIDQDKFFCAAVKMSLDTGKASVFKAAD